MSRTFAIIESGIVTNCIIADEWPGAVDVSGMTPRPAAGWTYDGEAFAPPAPVAPVIATTPRITHFGFLSRLTPQERTAVRAATAGDPILDDAMFLFNQARDIDVTLEATKQLVGYLALQGHIAPGRVPELLAPIPADSPHAVL